MKQKNVTLKTVADKAGVSITTVSHVINKTRHVNQDTKETVLKTLEELNYIGFKSRKANKIEYVGVIIADIREDYYVSITKAIETFASDMGISILICDSEDDPAKEKRNINMLLDRNVSGLIIAPIESENMPKGLTRSNIPVVLIDRQYENHDFLFVGINNLYSCYLGAKYLHEKGAERIGFIGYSESVYTIKQRVLGYKTYQQEMENGRNPAVLSLSYHKENSYPLIKNFIEQENIDGIICATSAVCYELVSVINDLPEEQKKKLKVITYDDNKWFDYLNFPVSVVSQPTAEIGNAAIENLISLIEHKGPIENVKRELLYDTSIIDRL
ncbi:LacI family transcriptional regulator [Oceanispirochaeta crateris]|uniref:LacI family transcriptional regulator n=1 Tax=Oceanispirochaeta crateris TaxID=2518645 RepID=A0A5C1QMJ1_9SPIO|nr:LacI family DNA-binding transcriptional regulator [Oceanispirochaeta crateris]QEN08180.1 LacI family transcriptional regulator [Oceanispirochaeta crateris]